MDPVSKVENVEELGAEAVVRVPEGYPVTRSGTTPLPTGKRDTEETQPVAHLAEIDALNHRLEVAIRESNHRVLNNLQILAALIDMQLMEQPKQVPVTELVRLSAQIHTLAAVHMTLTHGLKEAPTGHSDRVSARSVLQRLLTKLQAGEDAGQIVAHLEDAFLSSSRATSLGMAAAELCSNALRHGREPVELTLSVQQGKALLEVCDSGPGFPAGFDPALHETTGLQLILSLVRRDLRGEVHFANRPQGGAQVTVIFPLQSTV